MNLAKIKKRSEIRSHFKINELSFFLIKMQTELCFPSILNICWLFATKLSWSEILNHSNDVTIIPFVAIKDSVVQNKISYVFQDGNRTLKLGPSSRHERKIVKTNIPGYQHWDTSSSQGNSRDLRSYKTIFLNFFQKRDGSHRLQVYSDKSDSSHR